MPIGTQSSYIPVDSCQGCKEAAKKGRREILCKKTRGDRRKEEGGGGHLVLSIHDHSTKCRNERTASEKVLISFLRAMFFLCSNPAGASGYRFNPTVLTQMFQYFLVIFHSLFFFKQISSVSIFPVTIQTMTLCCFTAYRFNPFFKLKLRHLHLIIHVLQ